MGRRVNNKQRISTQKDAQSDQLSQPIDPGVSFPDATNVTMVDPDGPAVVAPVRDTDAFNPFVHSGHNRRFVALDTTDKEYPLHQRPKQQGHLFRPDDGPAAVDVGDIDSMSSPSTADSAEPRTTTHEVLVDRIFTLGMSLFTHFQRMQIASTLYARNFPRITSLHSPADIVSLRWHPGFTGYEPSLPPHHRLRQRRPSPRGHRRGSRLGLCAPSLPTVSRGISAQAVQQLPGAWSLARFLCGENKVREVSGSARDIQL
ncbi:MAG: hypothetical protein LQ351_007127 [Letrouitia transgressa]|nr:MAG: hypothetical protein LQ351_007127 [Letrouitia transgressa]